MTTIEDVKSRGYTHCTIDSGMYGTFLAKVEYQDACRSWNPVEVLFEGKWISIDEFDDIDGYNSYGCRDYRQGELTFDEYCKCEWLTSDSTLSLMQFVSKFKKELQSGHNQ